MLPTGGTHPHPESFSSILFNSISTTRIYYFHSNFPCYIIYHPIFIFIIIIFCTESPAIHPSGCVVFVVSIMSCVLLQLFPTGPELVLSEASPPPTVFSRLP